MNKNSKKNIKENSTEEDTDFHSSQSQIGWREVLKGKVSSLFHKYSTPYMRKENTERKFTTELCTNIITIWQKAWFHRIHTVTLKEKEDRSGYDKLDEQFLDENNKKFILLKYEEHKSKSKKQILNWINLHYNSMKEIIERNKQNKD